MTARQFRAFRSALVAELEECNDLHTQAEKAGGWVAHYYMGRIASLTRVLYLLDATTAGKEPVLQ